MFNIPPHHPISSSNLVSAPIQEDQNTHVNHNPQTQLLKSEKESFFEAYKNGILEKGVVPDAHEIQEGVSADRKLFIMSKQNDAFEQYAFANLGIATKSTYIANLVALVDSSSEFPSEIKEQIRRQAAVNGGNTWDNETKQFREPWVQSEDFQKVSNDAYRQWNEIALPHAKKLAMTAYEKECKDDGRLFHNLTFGRSMAAHLRGIMLVQSTDTQLPLNDSETPPSSPTTYLSAYNKVLLGEDANKVSDDLDLTGKERVEMQNMQASINSRGNPPIPE
jgi:hypothetical protein